jgi:hypothetical protein
MRRNRTSESQRPMLRLVGDGEGRSGSASKIYGPVRAGLTTTQRTQSQALSESLNDLERQTQDLESRFLEACATLNTVMARLVELGLFGIKINTTDVIE